MKKIILVLLLIPLLVACSETRENIDFLEIKKDELSTISPTSGGTAQISIINYDRIDPLNPSNPSVYYFSKLLYDSLFEYNEDGNLEANLVEHHVLSPDNLILTITLKDNLYWHNGEKLTTKDILDTFNYIKNADNNSPYFDIFRSCVGYGIEFDINNFLKMEIFDDRNIDLHFNHPYSNYLEMLTFPILPSSEIKKLSHGNTEDFELTGSGAYKIHEIKDGVHIELERNENYHGKLPNIEKVNAKIFDDEKLAELAFETGQINLVKSTNYDWAKYQYNQRIKVEEYNSNELDLIYVNNNSPIFLGENGKIIKKAISKGINKKRIIDRLFLGQAIETSIPLNQNKMKEYGLKIETYYNEEDSKKLLNSIGYTNINDDGFLVNENGETIDIKVETNFANKYMLIISEFIIEDLRAIGIRAYTESEINSVDEMSYEQIEVEKNKFINNLKTGNYNLAITTVNLTELSDLGRLLHSHSIGDSLNYSFYSNPIMDQLLTNMKVTHSDEEIKEYYIEIIKIFNEDNPMVPLYIRKNALLVDDKIQGRLTPSETDLFKSFRNAFILKQFQ